MQLFPRSFLLLAVACALCLPAMANEKNEKTAPRPAPRPPAERPPAPRPPLERQPAPRPAVERPSAHLAPEHTAGIAALAPARKTPPPAEVQAASPEFPDVHKNKEVETPSLAQEHWKRHDVDSHVFVRLPVKRVWVYNQAWTKYPNLHPEVEKLRDAYLALSRASLEYNGFRHAAMHQTIHAGGVLGIELGGDGAGEESPEASDAQMAAARELLAEVHHGLAVKGYPYAAGQVEIAVNDISLGLNEN